MVQFVSSESLPSKEYVRNLGRCGLDLRNWSADPRGTSENGQDGLVYQSWTDGNLGIFGTDTGDGPVAIDAETSDDMIAFGIGLGERFRSFRIANSVTDDKRGLEILCLPKGSRLQIDTGSSGLRSVTLLVHFDELRSACGVADEELSDALSVILRERVPRLIHRSLPVMVQRTAEAVIGGPASAPFAQLFYRAKASELLWMIMEGLRQGEQTPGDTLVNQIALNGIERVRQAIEEQATRNWTTDELSRIAGMNRTKLRALFKRIHGMTIFDYRTAVIMRRADEMLQHSELSVAEIGFRLGYGEPSSFNMAYKRFYGHSPGYLRRRH